MKKIGTMKKLTSNQLENTQGGIECGQMQSVISMLYQTNYAQYASLCGLTLQCTITQYGVSVWGSIRTC